MSRWRLCITCLKPPAQLYEHQVEFVGSESVVRISRAGVTPSSFPLFQVHSEAGSLVRQDKDNGKMQLKKD